MDDSLIPAGFVRRNNLTGDVAIRTIFDPENFPDNVWIIATAGSGAKCASSADVQGWDELYNPEGV